LQPDGERDPALHLAAEFLRGRQPSWAIPAITPEQRAKLEAEIEDCMRELGPEVAQRVINEVREKPR
jgi:hypothetical protein